MAKAPVGAKKPDHVAAPRMGAADSLCVPPRQGSKPAPSPAEHNGSTIHNRVDLRLASQNLGCQGV
jgi:hypothetical protein